VSAAQYSLPWTGLEPSTPSHARLVLHPEARQGLRPSKACAERLLWAKNDRLPQLLSAVHLGICPRPLYDRAVIENPELIAQMERDYFKAGMWERERYGDLYAEFTTRQAVQA